MKTFTKRTKGTMIALLLCFAFICGAFVLFGNISTTAFAYEQSEVHEHDNQERGLESYAGYGCNNGVDLQVNLSKQTENEIPEFIDGFGCGSSCGASREGGYSSTYHSGCRNWQVMPIIGPMFKYWIDESTLNDMRTIDELNNNTTITTTVNQQRRQQFIADVDRAAAEWNSVRINDYSGAIVNLRKQSSNGIDVVPIRYNPNLSGASGKFNPIPLFHWIEIKYPNDYDTIMHEFGHMIGLQDLDMNNDPWTHISLMGYAGDDKLHYQDIQGLAVANYKHTTHDYRKYWRDGAWYNYVCFYCDITDSVLTSWSGGTQLADATSCLHTYERLASAGNRYWQKCHKCYKVVESEFTVSVKDTNSIEIAGLIDNRATITIPRQIGGQNVTYIGNGAFLGKPLTSVTFENNSNVTTIGNSAFSGCTSLQAINFGTSLTLQTIENSAFSGCTQLSQISIPASVRDINTGVFRGCTGLQTVTFLGTSQLQTIGVSAFSGCMQLSQITIPASTMKIGAKAFWNCVELSTILIPQSVRTIGANAFQYCTNLTIYTERVLRPVGWSNDWNSSGCPVIWGGNERQPYNDSITLSSYNYPSQYNNFTPISEDIISQSGQLITTSRLRCGVIDYSGKSYLTVSAKNKDANEAYLEYYFPDCLLEIDYQLALWSSSESLTLNSSIRLEALYAKQWTTVRTFSAASMSQDKDLLMDYSTVLSEPTRAIRFIVETNQVNNDNNRGRVVIGGINAVYLEYNHEHDLVYTYMSPNWHTFMCLECDYIGKSLHSFFLNKCLVCDYTKNPNYTGLVHEQENECNHEYETEQLYSRFNI